MAGSLLGALPATRREMNPGPGAGYPATRTKAGTASGGEPTGLVGGAKAGPIGSKSVCRELANYQAFEARGPDWIPTVCPPVWFRRARLALLLDCKPHRRDKRSCRGLHEFLSRPGHWMRSDLSDSFDRWHA
jgi:hypothetical protein